MHVDGSVREELYRTHLRGRVVWFSFDNHTASAYDDIASCA